MLTSIISYLTQTTGFMPHGMCLLWRPVILWTMVFGNGLIALSYFMIPVALIYLIAKRKDIGFKWIFVLFGLFILACGITHVMAIIVLWKPMYALESFILAITGFVSFLTAVLLWPLLPVLFKIPSPWQLEKMNLELRQSNEALAHSELMQSKLAAIMEYTNDAVMSIDLQGKITIWNRGAEDLYGYSAADMLGQNIIMLFPIDRLHELTEILREVPKGHAIHLIDTIRVGKDNKLINLSISVSPIKDKNDQIVGLSSIERDISTWKEVQKLKEEFIAMVSHELRTPLTSIQGSLSFLELFAAEAEMKELVDIAKRNSERLVRLVNDILDLSKMEAGKLNIKLEKIDMDYLLKETIINNRGYAKNFNLDIQFESDNKPHDVLGDKDRLMQVISNLISNAIKFSDTHEDVLVRVNNTNTMVRVEVLNKGPGIPEKLRHLIFKKFSQVQIRSSGSQGGTGLGLSISKELIEKMNGHIGFESIENDYTLFYFELPLAKEPVDDSDTPSYTK